MGEFAIGQSVRRREDPRLLRGQGRYFDDLKLADQLYAAIVRSPHAHAEILSIDTSAAKAMSGVHAVLTGNDYHADGIGSLPSMAPYKKRDGSPMFLPPRPAIAIGRAMHVGYPVAVVVADTLDQVGYPLPRRCGIDIIDNRFLRFDELAMQPPFAVFGPGLEPPADDELLVVDLLLIITVDDVFIGKITDARIEQAFGHGDFWQQDERSMQLERHGTGCVGRRSKRQTEG